MSISNPPLMWGKCPIQMKLALLAKKSFVLETAFGPQPERVQLHFKSIYKKAIAGAEILNSKRIRRMDVKGRKN